MEGREKDTGEVNRSHRTGETISLSSSFCSNFCYQWVIQPPSSLLPPSPLRFPSHLSWFSHPPLWWQSVISYLLPSFAKSRTRPRAPPQGACSLLHLIQTLARRTRVHIWILYLPRFNLYMVYKSDSFCVIELNGAVFDCEWCLMWHTLTHSSRFSYMGGWHTLLHASGW